MAAVAKGVPETEEIKRRVVKWIQGKHSMIGIVLPENDPDPHDLSEIYRTIAEVSINEAKRRAAQK